MVITPLPIPPKDTTAPPPISIRVPPEIMPAQPPVTDEFKEKIENARKELEILDSLVEDAVKKTVEKMKDKKIQEYFGLKLDEEDLAELEETLKIIMESVIVHLLSLKKQNAKDLLFNIASLAPFTPQFIETIMMPIVTAKIAVEAYKIWTSQ